MLCAVIWRVLGGLWGLMSVHWPIVSMSVSRPECVLVCTVIYNIIIYFILIYQNSGIIVVPSTIS